MPICLIFFIKCNNICLWLKCPNIFVGKNVKHKICSQYLNKKWKQELARLNSLTLNYFPWKLVFICKFSALQSACIDSFLKHEGNQPLHKDNYQQKAKRPNQKYTHICKHSRHNSARRGVLDCCKHTVKWLVYLMSYQFYMVINNFNSL